MANFKEELPKVKAFVFDVDGVFSNARLILHHTGTLQRTMSTKDGYAVQYAVKKGYIVAIISGGKDEAVRKRFQGLGVTDIYLNAHDKLEAFNDLLYKYDLKESEILYMGDDIPDYDVMIRVGLPTCPADASEEIIAISKYISDKNGGEGCVRDVIEQVLRVHGKWHKTN